MSKFNKDQEEKALEAFEMIELASADLEVLTRAFKVIEEICEERNNSTKQEESEEQAPAERWLIH